jgi:hypothetical protein
VMSEMRVVVGRGAEVEAGVEARAALRRWRSASSHLRRFCCGGDIKAVSAQFGVRDRGYGGKGM